MMKQAGIDGQTDKNFKGISFLFLDTQIIHETFLEDINNMLNSGEVPNLWDPEEKEKMINDMTPIVIKMKIPEDPDNKYKTFV